MTVDDVCDHTDDDDITYMYVKNDHEGYSMQLWYVSDHIDDDETDQGYSSSRPALDVICNQTLPQHLLVFVRQDYDGDDDVNWWL